MDRGQPSGDRRGVVPLVAESMELSSMRSRQLPVLVTMSRELISDLPEGSSKRKRSVRI
jgi:hypothetical protein